MFARPIILLVLTLSSAAVTAQTPSSASGLSAITIEDLIQVQKPSEIGISPDGKWVSFVLTSADMKHVLFFKFTVDSL